MSKLGKPEYLAKIRQLTEEETARLLSRMRGKLPRRLEKHKISQEEAMALQMELEDEQLLEWRKVMEELKIKEDSKKQKEKAKAKEKDSPQPMPSSKSKAPAKSTVTRKSKATPGD